MKVVVAAAQLQRPLYQNTWTYRLIDLLIIQHWKYPWLLVVVVHCATIICNPFLLWPQNLHIFIRLFVVCRHRTPSSALVLFLFHHFVYPAILLFTSAMLFCNDVNLNDERNVSYLRVIRLNCNFSMTCAASVTVSLSVCVCICQLIHAHTNTLLIGATLYFANHEPSLVHMKMTNLCKMTALLQTLGVGVVADCAQLRHTDGTI